MVAILLTLLSSALACLVATSQTKSIASEKTSAFEYWCSMLAHSWYPLICKIFQRSIRDSRIYGKSVQLPVMTETPVRRILFGVFHGTATNLFRAWPTASVADLCTG